MNNIVISTGIVCEEKDMLLMVKEYRKDEGIRYNQPVGKLETNESIQEAAKRESFEETGYKINIINLVGIYSWIVNETYTSIRFSFRASIEGGNIKSEHTDSDGTIVKPIWIPSQSIIREKIKLRNPVVLQVVKDFLAGESYPLELIHHFDK